MKGLSKFFSLALFVFSLLVACAPARAQQTTNVFLIAIPTSNAVPVNGSIHYQFYITNVAGFAFIDSFLTNSFSAAIQIIEATNNHSGVIRTNGNIITFHTSQILGFGTDIASIGLTVRPLSEGLLTNSFTLFGTQLTTNVVGQLVNQVTNVPGALADVAVGLKTPSGTFYPNDSLTYSLFVTNLGPNVATNVVLTNGLKGLTFLNASPKQTSRSGTNVVFNLGNLANQGFKILNVTVQATNTAGTNSLSAFATPSGNTDPDTTNNSVSADIIVAAFLTNQLVAVTNNTTQVFNPQIGLMEQGILLSNASPSAVPSARVMVAGIRNTDRLFNAVGTNNGLPFVELPTTLGASETVAMLLQFYVPSHAPFPLPNSNLTAQALSAPVDLTPPPNLIPLTNTANGYTRIANLTSKVLIEFPSTDAAVYAVVYSDDVAFTTSRVARPFIVAPANWTYWYDYGPPTTVSAPTNSAARFYKVFQVPN